MKMRQQQQHRYFIHDYRTVRATEAMDFNQWKSETCELTENMTIVKWHTFRSPLKTLGPLGPFIMRLSFISPFAFFMNLLLPLLFLAFVSPYFLFLHFFLAAIFAIYFNFWNRHFRIEHGFAVLELVNDDNRVYVSLEKLSGGILFQVAQSLEAVREYANDTTRGEVEKVSSSESLCFDAMLGGIVTMELILQSDEMFDAYYNVLRSNCQHTVSELLDCITKNSLQLEFCIPGSEDSVSLNDSAAVMFVERLYPKWVEGKVQQFPEIPDPFAFDVEGLPQPELPEHRLLLIKQRIINCLLEDNSQFHGRKAVFSKLDEESLKARLNETDLGKQSSATTIIDQIASFWNDMLDIVSVIEGLGVTIFHFPDGEGRRDHILDVERKLELVSKLECFSNTRENRACAVTVMLADEGNEVKLGPVKLGKSGCKISVSLPCDAKDSQLKECLGYCMTNLVPSSPWSCISNLSGFVPHQDTQPPEKALQRFTAKLFLLQNMKNQDFLIHKRIVNQEFGAKEFCVWTPQQKNIIDEARATFRKKERPKIQWVVHGCYGSGKTLLLVQLVKEFLLSGNKGNIFIFTESAFEKLTSLINSCISENGWEERVSVGCEPKSFDGVCLFLWDEYLLMQSMLPSQKELFRRLRSSNPSMVLFTSQSESTITGGLPSISQNVAWMSNISVKSLGGNLRSSVEISNMTEKLQDHLKRNHWPSGETVISNLRWKSGEPTITTFHDDSNERLTFLRGCETRIKQLSDHKKVMVTPLTHAPFQAMLKDACRERDEISFGTNDEIFGHQYQCIVMILDLATCDFLHAYLIAIMTRATTSLHFIINTSLEPICIHGMPSFQYEYRLSHTIESRVKALTATASHEKKVWIYDRFDVLEATFAEEIKDAAMVEKRDLSTSVTASEIEEESKKFSLIVELVPVSTGLLSSGFWYAHYPPSIVIQLSDDEDNLQRVMKSKYRDLERQREVVLQFFVSYLDGGDDEEHNNDSD